MLHRRAALLFLTLIASGGAAEIQVSAHLPSNVGCNVPIELTSNKPYAGVQVNGRGPYAFLLDTGASFNVLDNDRASALGISATGKKRVRGAGEGSLTSGVAKNVALALSGLSLPSRDIQVLAVNAALSQVEGRAVDGLLGYDFFKQFVVEIDYAAQRVNVYDPTNRPPVAGDRIPLRIVREHALVAATLVLSDGRSVPGEFMVDTGWRSGVTLNAPFSKAKRIPRTVEKTIEGITGIGIGGPTKDVIGRISSLKLGQFAVERPVVAFSKSGIASDDSFSGIIGGEVLRRFKVVLDYPGQQMFLEPNPNFSEPYEFDMSGMFLTAGAEGLDKIQVREVLNSSPAFEAGVRPGDVIAAVDNLVAAQLSLERVRKLFKERVGKEYLLTVERGPRSLQVKIQLRRLI